jgi:hypothetical protein
MKRATVGTLSWGGGVVERVFDGTRILFGEISSLGSPIRKFAGKRILSGEISFSGFVEGIKRLIHAATVGVLTFAGSLSRLVNYYRTEDGELSGQEGTINRLAEVRRAASGATAFLGSVVRQFSAKRVLDGAVSFLGIVTAIKWVTVFIRSISGFVGFDGVLKRMVASQRTAMGSFFLLPETLSGPLSEQGYLWGSIRVPGFCPGS